MIQCNISNDDRLIIEPWISIKNIIKIDHPMIIYGYLGDLLDKVIIIK